MCDGACACHIRGLTVRCQGTPLLRLPSAIHPACSYIATLDAALFVFTLSSSLHIRMASTAMRVVALVSGGKDSCYAMLECIRAGHSIAAIATLLPPPATVDEVDSHCFQTIGHQLVHSIAQCTNIPFYSRHMRGTSVVTALHYTRAADDEVEDLYELLVDVLGVHPDVDAVCTGAILSHYQRLRVEHVASRLRLTSLAPLWQREQRRLLADMIDSDMDAVLVKVASMGLGKTEVGRSIADVQQHLHEVEAQYGVNVCGEGGEYESLVLDCALFADQRIVLDEYEVITEHGDIAPVSLLRIKRWSLHDKPAPPPAHLLAPVTRPPSSAHAYKPLSGAIHPLPANWCPESSSLAQLFPRLRVRGGLGFLSSQPLPAVECGASAVEQFNSALTSVGTLLSTHSLSVADIASLTLILPDISTFSSINAAYARHLPAESPPSRACLQLPSSSLLVDAVLVSSASPLTRSSLHVQSVSQWAPACIGPYSQCVTAGPLLWMAGQIGLHPWTMQVTRDENEDGKVEVDEVWRNCSAVLAAMRSSLSSCLLTVVFVTSTSTSLLHTLHSSYSSVSGPILTVLVPALPRAATVEVQQLAYQPSSSLKATEGQLNLKLDGDTIQVRCQWSLVPETLLSCLCTLSLPRPAHQASALHLSSAMSAIVNTLCDRARRAELTMEKVWVVRVYYTVGLDVCELERALYAAWCGCGVLEVDMPAVSWLPVYGVVCGGDSDGGDVALLSVFCLLFDPDMLVT